MAHKHTPNNWIIILSALAANGPMTSGQIRQQLCLLRNGHYDARRDRGTYTWYTSHGTCNIMGLDYEYMERLPRDENGVVLYQITTEGHKYLRANYSKPGYGCSWRRRWGR